MALNWSERGRRVYVTDLRRAKEILVSGSAREDIWQILRSFDVIQKLPEWLGERIATGITIVATNIFLIRNRHGHTKFLVLIATRGEDRALVQIGLQYQKDKDTYKGTVEKVIIETGEKERDIRVRKPFFVQRNNLGRS